MASAVDWRPIDTAPRDGTLIEITALEDDGTPFEIWPMRWDAELRNGLFPGAVGFWAAPDRSITWNEDSFGGPTHWRPLPKPN